MTTSTKPLHEERIEEPAKAWAQWSIGDELPSWRLIRNDIGTNRPEFVGAFPEGQRP